MPETNLAEGERPVAVRWSIPELEGHAYNDTSQFGEDGLIERSLKLLGETNRWCFEIGASDGVTLSNTYRLRALGWSAVLIEREDHEYEKLKGFSAHNSVHTVHRDVKPHELTELLCGFGGFPENPDLGVIDVDGPDYEFLYHLELRPRVLMVEFHQTQDNPAWSKSQVGRTAIKQLGMHKQYAAVAETTVNMLFWSEEAIEEAKPCSS